ncbi:MAG: Asd/ArgC dimerization domain-containing protein [Phycisphaerales bacterium]|jgi:aspartate-semialdehyde dehydrogenase|nr:Asd/ArgC dimerization domain-containing protein [Phycisphaerales bacterium]
MPIPDDCRVAVVGATGLVGRELVTILQTQGVTPIPASSPPADCDICVLATPEEVSRQCVAAAAGGRFVDMSSAFRADPAIPLVVPSLNAAALRGAPAVVASPNCTATMLALAIAPFMRWGIERVEVTTCQAASGGGEAALETLETQTRAALRGDAIDAEPWAFNVFCHESPVDPVSGRSGEEQKVVDETRRILDRPELDITPTCLRVPVRRAHVASVTLELSEAITAEDARGAIRPAEDLRLIDRRSAHAFPSTHSAEHGDTVDVGHIRVDARRISFITAGDQLRIGAALNAARIVAAMCADQEPQ